MRHGIARTFLDAQLPAMADRDGLDSAKSSHPASIKVGVSLSEWYLQPLTFTLSTHATKQVVSFQETLPVTAAELTTLV